MVQQPGLSCLRWVCPITSSLLQQVIDGFSAGCNKRKYIRNIRQTGASWPVGLIMFRLVDLKVHVAIVTRVAWKLTWCHTTAIPVLQRLKQEERVLEAGPSCMVIAYLNKTKQGQSPQKNKTLQPNKQQQQQKSPTQPDKQNRRMGKESKPQRLF